MGGCAGDVGQGIGSIGSMTGHRAPAGTDNYIRAGEKAIKTSAMNEQDEDAMGQAVAVALTNQYGLNDDESLLRYVTLVGLTVASGSSRPDGNYVFGVLNSDVVNAFSGPNGYILITRGALARMQNEAELAGVLAHEIAHVVNHDGINAVKQAGMLDAAVEAGKGASGSAAQFGTLTDGVVDVVLKKGYSKEQEFTADADAVKLLVASGYDPGSYQDYLRRMPGNSAGGSGGSLMSTHPGMDQRVTRLDSEIGSQRRGATLKDRFVTNVHLK
jgi:predicted Zn-dependent protease